MQPRRRPPRKIVTVSHGEPNVREHLARNRTTSKPGTMRSETQPAIRIRIRAREGQSLPTGAPSRTFWTGPRSTPIPSRLEQALSGGSWTSKMGDREDIEHAALKAVSGLIYGRPKLFLRRPFRRATASSPEGRVAARVRSDSSGGPKRRRMRARERIAA